MGKIDVLKTVPIFSDLADAKLRSVVGKMISKSYKRGRMIIKEESVGNHCYFLTRGRVKITQSSSNEREVILALLGPGDFFGEMSLLTGEVRSANVVALEKTKALLLNTEDFLKTLEKYPKVAINLLRELAIRIQKSDKQIVSLSLSDAERRIAISILRVAEEQGMIYHGNVTIDPLPSQQDIANMAGTTRETVSRTYRFLVEDGYVQRIGKKLIILDFKRFVKDFSLS